MPRAKAERVLGALVAGLLLSAASVAARPLDDLQRAGKKKDFEAVAAYSAMERESLDWAQWAARLQDYYQHLQFLFSPDLFVVGGGVSKHADQFLPLLQLDTPIIPAVHRNNAGIIGAAALTVGDAG